ncbi:hypothetical protein BXO88_06145 [Oribacterium sp. C9]|nr:hypothetical protein BXO88_06145 [Oribacterium sp. C9]
MCYDIFKVPMNSGILKKLPIKSQSKDSGYFSGLNQIYTKILITHDDIDYSTSNVKHIKLKDFLLMETLK